MASSLDTPSPRARGHGRSPSGDERRRAVPRRLTKGPLDQAEDDPLSSSDPPSARSTSPAVRARPSLLKPRSPQPGGASRSPSRALEDFGSKDFTFLTRPENFHPLPADAMPAAFAASPHAAPTSTPLDILVGSGHFHTAAVAAAQHLVALPQPLDLPLLFGLLHTRLACLTLVDQTPLAASESKVLGDMSSAFYRDAAGAHVVPWDLRVLAVRLQALGFGEWRRGIMQYYMLASEARQLVVQARRERDRQAETLWAARLRDLGVRVASVLVEMGDIEAAGRHLRMLELEPGLAPEERRRFVFMEALVWLRLGDLRAARRCVYRLRGQAGSSPASPAVEAPSWESGGGGGGGGGDDDVEDFTVKVLSAMLRTAEGDFSVAVDEWRSLNEEEPDDAMVAQNLAVCLLYTGHLSEARLLLQQLVDSHAGFRSLLFNLCTVYELCTEKARELKITLTEHVAGMEPDGSGWERAAVDFKL